MIDNINISILISISIWFGRGGTSEHCSMMRMAFFWTTDLGDFFFKDLKVNGVWPLALACLVVGILAILYEGIKVWTRSPKHFHRPNEKSNIIFLFIFRSFPLGGTTGAFGDCASSGGPWTNRSCFMCTKRNGQSTGDGSKCSTEIILQAILQTVQRGHRIPLPQFHRLYCHVELHGVQRLDVFGCCSEHGPRLFPVRTHFDENQHGECAGSIEHGHMFNGMSGEWWQYSRRWAKRKREKEQIAAIRMNKY